MGSFKWLWRITLNSNLNRFVLKFTQRWDRKTSLFTILGLQMEMGQLFKMFEVKIFHNLCYWLMLVFAFGLLFVLYLFRIFGGLVFYGKVTYFQGILDLLDINIRLYVWFKRNCIIEIAVRLTGSMASHVWGIWCVHLVYKFNYFFIWLITYLIWL